MTVRKLARAFLVAGIMLSLVGCAGTQGGFWPKGETPPGISKRVAARVDTLAERLFVPFKREQAALQLSREGQRHYAVSDSLWPAWDALQRKDTKPAQTGADSTAAPAAGEIHAQAQSRNGTDYASTSKIRIQAIFNLKQAREKLEKSLRQDPFKPLARHRLALTYKLFAERFPHEVPLERAAETWSVLALLEPGEYRHFLNLGNTYFAMGQWSKALTQFQLAESLLDGSAAVSNARVDNPSLPQSAWIDSTDLFNTVYLQAQTLIKQVIAERKSPAIREAETALEYLEKARGLTSSAKWHALIVGDIKYITWDENNIWGSALRDSAQALAGRGDFRKAADIYDQLLNRVLETKRAKNDVKWDYAKIEYAKLKRRASAIARLSGVISDIEKDGSGAPVDTTYNSMFEDYGTMCYLVGLDTTRVNRKIAYEYFELAASIAWKDQGKIFLRMAELTRANIELSLQHAEKALPHETSFNSEEKKLLFDLLAQGYRRKGETDRARIYFEKFRELQ